MVPDPRAPLGARSLRSLSGGRDAPRTPDGHVQILVEVDADDRPTAVRRRHWPRPRAVARVQDRWRIDDEWWRERPISRIYHRLLLDDGALLVVYHDEVAGTWFESEARLRRIEPLEVGSYEPSTESWPRIPAPDALPPLPPVPPITEI